MLFHITIRSGAEAITQLRVTDRKGKKVQYSAQPHPHNGPGSRFSAQ